MPRVICYLGGRKREGIKNFLSSGVKESELCKKWGMCQNADMKYPIELLRLIALFKKLPGVGSKTAERFAFQLLTWNEAETQMFAEQVAITKKRIKFCPTCGCMGESDAPCSFCDKTKRDTSCLCIISSAKDAFAIEETHIFKGLYHVINGLLSPIDGKTPEKIGIEALKKRIHDLQVKEIIIALDSTLEGDTTSLYLKEQLSLQGISVSRLALGLPMGSSLDFIDGGTLSRALLGRQLF